MFCNQCGAEINDGSTFCPKCGAQIGGSAGSSVTVSQDGTVVSGGGQPQLGLKWAHFLCYFALWLGALVNLANGFMYLSGVIYEIQTAGTGIKVTAEMVYDVYGSGLSAVDKIFGVALIVAAVLGVLSALSIIKMKANAGKLLMILYGINVVASVGYLAAIGSITHENPFDGQTAVSIVISIAMLVINYIYFNNRKHMFVN